MPWNWKISYGEWLRPNFCGCRGTASARSVSTPGDLDPSSTSCCPDVRRSIRWRLPCSVQRSSPGRGARGVRPSAFGRSSGYCVLHKYQLGTAPRSVAHASGGSLSAGRRLLPLRFVRAAGGRGRLRAKERCRIEFGSARHRARTSGTRGDAEDAPYWKLHSRDAATLRSIESFVLSAAAARPWHGLCIARQHA